MVVGDGRMGNCRGKGSSAGAWGIGLRDRKPNPHSSKSTANPDPDLNPYPQHILKPTLTLIGPSSNTSCLADLRGAIVVAWWAEMACRAARLRGASKTKMRPSVAPTNVRPNADAAGAAKERPPNC